jgi:endonuclease YncB( thermonuclease family)
VAAPDRGAQVDRADEMPSRQEVLVTATIHRGLNVRRGETDKAARGATGTKPGDSITLNVLLVRDGHAVVYLP